MGPIFLSGGGDKKFTKKLDEGFISVIDREKPLLYIPVAMKNILAYEDCYEWANDLFNSLGIQKIVMWTEIKQRNLKDLERFSAVYIGGGNTFSLLDELRGSGFDQTIVSYIHKGGIVYGGSAGAIIMGSDIQTCAHLDENEVALTDTSGFALIGNYAIWCHYNDMDDEKIRNFILENKKPVIALPEETGICFNEKIIKVTGTKPAFVFNEAAKKAEVEIDSFRNTGNRVL